VNKLESYYDEKSLAYDGASDSVYFQIYDAITWKYLELHIPSSFDALVLDAGGGNWMKYLTSYFTKNDSMTKDGKVKIYTWTPGELHNLLERNGFNVQKIVGKGMTMPLRITEELYMKKECSKDLLSRILQLELNLCDKPDALALAGHIQAIVLKS